MPEMHHISTFWESLTHLLYQAKESPRLGDIFGRWKIPNLLSNTVCWDYWIFCQFETHILDSILEKSEFLLIKVYASPRAGRQIWACQIEHTFCIVFPQQTIANASNYICESSRNIIEPMCVSIATTYQPLARSYASITPKLAQKFCDLTTFTLRQNRRMVHVLRIHNCLLLAWRASLCTKEGTLGNISLARKSVVQSFIIDQSARQSVLFQRNYHPRQPLHRWINIDFLQNT